MALNIANKINRNIVQIVTRRSISKAQPQSAPVAPSCAPHELKFEAVEPRNEQSQPKKGRRKDCASKDERVSSKGELLEPAAEPIEANQISTIPASSSYAYVTSQNLRCSPLAKFQGLLKHQLKITDPEFGGAASLEVLTSNNGIRYFSSKRCGKEDESKKRGRCKKFKLCNCEQTASYDCWNRIYSHPECKKKEAPYPSFSEACYEEPYNKPSECRLCPWRVLPPYPNHPTFKRKTRNRGFHTFVREFSTSVIKKALFKVKDMNKCPRAMQSTAVLDNNYTHLNAMVLNNLPDGAVNESLPQQTPPASSIGSYECQKKKKKNWKPGQKGNCVKFPFKADTYEIGKKKEQKKVEKDDACVKKRRKLIQDCPPDAATQKKCDGEGLSGVVALAFNNGLLEYNLADDDKGSDKSGKKDKVERKCPRVSYESCDDADVSQCPPKREPSRICPEDLVRKPGYRPAKKKKKTEAGEVYSQMLLQNNAQESSCQN